MKVSNDEVDVLSEYPQRGALYSDGSNRWRRYPILPTVHTQRLSQTPAIESSFVEHHAPRLTSNAITSGHHLKSGGKSARACG